MKKLPNSNLHDGLHHRENIIDNEVIPLICGGETISPQKYLANISFIAVMMFVVHTAKLQIEPRDHFAA